VVVDDDPGMLKAVQRLLTAKGYDTAGFPSAEAFLECSTRHEVTCLVLDVHLGGMSGVELQRQLAVSGCTAPVIFMTAFDDEATRNVAMAAGCIAYLHKPFLAHLLIDAIERSYSRRFQPARPPGR